MIKIIIKLSIDITSTNSPDFFFSTQDVDAARRIIAQQQRTIDKLRTDERNRQLSKEKENLQSSIVASPHKPSTPLKDRNV